MTHTKKTMVYVLMFISTLFSNPATILASPVISEICYDAPGGDTGSPAIFIELYAGETAIDLIGYRLEAVNGANGDIYATYDFAALGSSYLLPAGAVFVLGNVDLGTHYGAASSFANLQNGPDSLILREKETAAITDAIGYGSFTEQHFFAGEGRFVPGVDTPGNSLARLLAYDYNDNLVDFIDGAPTPGTVPFATAAPVPLPGGFLLLGHGLLGVMLLRRKRD